MCLQEERSIIDQIWLQKLLMDKHYEFDNYLYIFVDYKQACDSINREKWEELWKAMINCEIPKKYVDMIKLYNNKTVFKVKFLRKLSLEFDVNSGL